MGDAVWCVFQRLPGETCPRLAAVCASREAAESQVALSHREQEMGESPGVWTVQRWSVLDAEVRPMEEADRVSHALTGVRDALAGPPAAPPVGGIELSRLSDGDLLLLGGRPGQGKTLLSVDLAVQALEAGRAAVFFTLEASRADILRYVETIGADPGSFEAGVRIDSSDDISADHIIGRLRSAAPGTLVIVDYLQLLDQRRASPPLGEQVKALRDFARERGLVFVFLSQIHRSFGGEGGAVPGLADVRLPNPLDLTLFTKACFVHAGKVDFGPVAGGLPAGE